MEEMRDIVLAPSFSQAMKIWKSVAPVVAETSEKIASLAAKQQTTQLPFLGYSYPMETMIASIVIQEHIKSKQSLARVRTDEKQQQSIAALRNFVAKKTQENQSLKDALDRKDRELRELQYQFDLATGKIRLSPSEGGPSEK